MYDLLKRVDLAAFVQQEMGCKLTQHGDHWSGWCPLHAGTHPSSFGVTQSPEGVWLWKCLGCDLRGTIIDFCIAAGIEGVTTPLEAAVMLMDRLKFDEGEIMKAGAGDSIQMAYDQERAILNRNLVSSNNCRVLRRTYPQSLQIKQWVEDAYHRLDAAIDDGNIDAVMQVGSNAIKMLQKGPCEVT